MGSTAGIEVATHVQLYASQRDTHTRASLKRFRIFAPILSSTIKDFRIFTGPGTWTLKSNML